VINTHMASAVSALIWVGFLDENWKTECNCSN
jgi:hypothetical protein